MNLPLEQQYLYVQDQAVLSLAEFQSYTYGLPETAIVPGTLTRWVAGEPVDLDDLLECFRGEAAEAASSSDESLEIVRLAIERLEAL
ncbi:MAG TPA: hypothetical protein VK730_11075 [Solirubrobacteraceae bacterium]|jgi:hypothetical protein|nr:hypothetical protein [Solirubrobacteraceae bacterium]